MKRLKTNRIIQICLTGIISFWLLWFGLGLLAQFLNLRLSSYDIMIELSSSLVLGAAPVVTYLWFSAAKQAVVEGGEDDFSFLNFGLFTVYLFLSLHRIWATMDRWIEKPDWMIDSFVLPVILFGIFLGSVFLILTRDTRKGSIPIGNWRNFFISVAIGIAVAFLTIGFFLGKITN